jgi:peptidoglycan/xylan/chitin deacetylase (PgdA/CDA1 family)
MGPIHFILNVKLSIILLFLITLSITSVGCSAPVDIHEVEVVHKVLAPATIEKHTHFAGHDYTLVPLIDYQRSGLQVYWPSNSVIPEAIKNSLQFILPQVNSRFSKQYFAFNQVNEQGAVSAYKKVFFPPKISHRDNQALNVFMVGNNSLVVSYESNYFLNRDELFQQLIQFVYQSERLKYQADNNIFDKLVTRGLMLHFLQGSLPSSQFNIPIDIETSIIRSKLSQIKSELKKGADSGDWFNDKPLKQQVIANAVGYYLVAQHFSFYTGSNASNSFSLNSVLFLPWLEGPDIAVKKTHQHVRNVFGGNQVGVPVLTRQANLFVGHYFVEGLHYEKLIALSFDDGPSQYTSKILDILEKEQVTASFFWQGQYLVDYKDVVARTLKSGHTVANHSWNHDNGMTYSPNELWQKQVIKTNRVFQALFNITPRFYRPPYGDITDEQVAFLASKSMKVILWSVDSRDWDPALNSVRYIESTIINHQHEEMIPLLHDAGGNRQNTVDSLPSIIEYYKSQGYRFVNLETLLGISDKH